MGKVEDGRRGKVRKSGDREEGGGGEEEEEEETVIGQRVYSRHAVG